MVATMSTSAGAGVNGVSRQSVLDDRIQQLELSYRNAVSEEIRNNFDRIREIVWKRIYQRRPEIAGLHEDEDSDFELDTEELMSEAELQHHLRVHRWKSMAHRMAPKEANSRRRLQRASTDAGLPSGVSGRRGGSLGRGRGGRGGRRGSGASRERGGARERKRGAPVMRVNGQAAGSNGSRGRKRKSKALHEEAMEESEGSVDSGQAGPSALCEAKSKHFEEPGVGQEEEGDEEDEEEEEEEDDEDEESCKGGSFNPYDMEHINKMIKAQREQFYKKKGWIKEEDLLVTRRKKLWRDLIKKELGKTVRQRATVRKELLFLARKAARECARVVRQRALLSQKFARESLSRGKRLAREVSAYWRQQCGATFLNGAGGGFGAAGDGAGYGGGAGGGDSARARGRRVDRSAADQRRLDLELLEARRQQRKLNFLITQTELYAHFMARKMNSAGEPSAESAEEILSRLEEKEPFAASSEEVKDDPYDIEAIKSQALEMSRDAVERQMQRSRAMAAESIASVRDSSARDFSENPQPSLFIGVLKHYQLKGMNWLLTLFDQGINGILADEMGLGKTIQTIAFFGSLAEIYGIWGPFLVVAPASTLHNWTQEFARFTPRFKVVPYWGNPGERKVLRRYWHQLQQQQQKEGCLVAPEDASFHVVVTSYQVVLQDTKFVSRVNWQYMVLDEAHAIKNSSSQRWNTLLKFNCRNRLLLSGTPIQNNMQELWALLHFIMPTMFDSHDEFNEWFSKDIECHVTGGSDKSRRKIDENQLSRLHLILKPFMLRRVKTDVEHELSKKIEILLHCDMSRRQKLWYQHFKRRISWEELREAALADGTSNSSGNAATKSLMNIMMQMRKVCNHPDLMEKRDVRFSLVAPPLPPFRWPKLLTREMDGTFFRGAAARRHACILHPIHHRVEGGGCGLPLLYTLSLLTGLAPGRLFAWACWGPTLSLVRAWLRRQERAADQLFISRVADTAPALRFPLLVGSAFPTHPTNLRRCPCLREAAGLGATATISFLDWRILSARSARSLRCMAARLPDLVGATVVRRALAYPVPPYCVDRSAENRRAEVLRSRPELMSAGPGLTRCELVDFRTRIADSGKMAVLDDLLKELKADGHRVLIYSQMTKMIDLLEELMYFNNYRYMRLDGSSRLSDRRDMVTDFQTRTDIFIFLLSTRAGGLGINLTAADTVIFYDSDWNPTVDQQAMDRAHRLGQTKQVRVYRLVCRATVEERILRRADAKSEIHRMVISGGDFRPEVLRSGEVVSMLLDDEEMLERRRLMRSRARKSAGGTATPGDGSDNEGAGGAGGGSSVGAGGGGASENCGEGMDPGNSEMTEVKESLLDRKRKAAWARSRGRGGGRPKKFRPSASRDSLVLIETTKASNSVASQGKSSGTGRGGSNATAAAAAAAAALKKRKACVVFDASGNDM